MSVRVALVALAAMPVVGSGWFAVRELSSTSQAKEDTEQIAGLAVEYAELTRLRSFVLDERNWSLVTIGIRELGIPTEIVVSFTGIDPEQELEAARASVDEQVRMLESTVEGVAAAVRPLREDDVSIDLVGERYLTIERDLAARSDGVLRDLLELGGDVGDGAELISSLRVLEFGTEARQAVTSQLTTYFAAQFGADGDTVDHFALLVAQHAAYAQATAALDGVVQPDTRAQEQLESIRSSDDVAAFETAIGDLVTSALRTGIRESDYTSAAVFASVDQIVEVFTAGARSSAEHLELVEAAAEDVVSVSTGIAADHGADARNVSVMFIVLAATSFGAAFVLGLWAIGPLRQVAERARRLRDGDMTVEPPSHGPRELRDVSAALAEAAGNLALAESQARALADGELDAPVLTTSAPGRLGASLQEAVRTLATSLDEREELRLRLAHEAAHDALTALPNRNASLRALDGGLARVGRNGANLAVMFVDLDGFKAINDGHGHQAGDAVLSVVARRLEEGSRAGDHVGRLGGDEFLVVAEPVDGVDEALQIAHRIRAAISAPIEHDGTWHRVDASIGVALMSRQTSLTGDELLRDADFAVYKAKQLGRGRIELCDDSLRAEVQENHALERALRASIEAEQFSIHYQPIVDPAAETVGFEALLRWDRPGRGVVMPGEFVEFAERTDLIIDVENWVIRHVARQMAEWRDHPRWSRLSVAINISGRHFASEHLVDDILEPLREFGVEPGDVVIELTESAMIDVAGSLATLTTLRNAGVRIAVDDFGTGYASLGYLRSMPIDIIKIDRTFVADPDAAALIKVIVDAGHHIGATVTAEGVETRDQAIHLVELGCDRLQGYYFGRPVPPAQLDELDSPTVAAPAARRPS